MDFHLCTRTEEADNKSIIFVTNAYENGHKVRVSINVLCVSCFLNLATYYKPYQS